MQNCNYSLFLIISRSDLSWTKPDIHSSHVAIKDCVKLNSLPLAINSGEWKQKRQNQYNDPALGGEDALQE